MQRFICIQLALLKTQEEEKERDLDERRKSLFIFVGESREREGVSAKEEYLADADDALFAY